MRRALAVLAAACVCCLTLGACSHDEAAGPPTPSSSGPADPPPSSPTTSPPSSTPTNSAPTMPALAKHETTAGAKAFVRYYIDLLNHASTSQKTADLQAKSSASCVVCHNIISSISKARRNGGFQHGGTWSVKHVFLAPGGSPLEPQLLSEIAVSKGTWQSSAKGKLHRIKPQAIRDQFRLNWVPSMGWLVEEITEL